MFSVQTWKLETEKKGLISRGILVDNRAGQVIALMTCRQIPTCDAVLGILFLNDSLSGDATKNIRN